MPTIKVTVTDDDTGMVMETVSPTVSNVTPTIAPITDAEVLEANLFELTPMGEPPRVTFTDPGVADTFTATVDWGDGTATESLAVTFAGGAGSLDGSHVYADNGLYTVTITLTDDDTGVAVADFQVRVDNLNPELTGTDDLMVDEGQEFTLAELGVGVSDPSFDNPLNTDPGTGGEVEEFFLDGVIDWGDGSATTPVTFVDRMSGSEGVPTIATPEHAAHAYADNGEYTVTITFSDDDGPPVERSFQIEVKNVAPGLTLNDPMAVINEGDTLTLPMLGELTDPGFNNPLNPNGASVESFTFEVDWGDGVIDTDLVPAITVDGAQGVATTGILAASHTYADNDADNKYTIRVTVTDDDGGVSVTREIEVTVLNVDPTLEPIAATDLEGAGITTLDLTFSDPGADTFEVLVDWGDKPDLPPEERFVVERLHAGETPQSFTIQHTYTGPPDPTNPSADILIRVKIHDDDVGTPGIVTSGVSNIEEVLISNPGIDDNQVAIDTTPQAPALEFPDRPEMVQGIEQSSDTGVETTTTTDGAAASELSIGAERYLELRAVSPEEVEGPGIRLKDATLDDLPALFALLPEGRYRIYVVFAETNTRRLALDVNIRGGSVIDPSDDTDGGRDRPPVEENIPLPQDLTRLTPEAKDPEAAAVEENAESPATTAAVAAVGLASQTDWAKRVERALTRADEGRWRRLLRRRPR